MLVVLGFLLASAIGLVTVLAVGRRGLPQRSSYPWMLDEAAKLHVGIMGTLAGFAFTGIVLVVTLAHDRAGVDATSLDTVVASGDLVQRVHFSLASTIEYRTVFLSWFALLPLLEANGLGRLSHVLYFLLPASLLLGSVIIAMAADGLGLLLFKETYISAVVGTSLALAYAAIVAFALSGARSPYSSLVLALVIFCVNSVFFMFAALTPLSPKYGGIRRLYERHGRRIVMADMQLTIMIGCGAQ